MPPVHSSVSRLSYEVLEEANGPSYQIRPSSLVVAPLYHQYLACDAAGKLLPFSESCALLLPENAFMRGLLDLLSQGLRSLGWVTRRKKTGM